MIKQIILIALLLAVVGWLSFYSFDLEAKGTMYCLDGNVEQGQIKFLDYIHGFRNDNGGHDIYVYNPIVGRNTTWWIGYSEDCGVVLEEGFRPVYRGGF